MPALDQQVLPREHRHRLGRVLRHLRQPLAFSRFPLYYRASQGQRRGKRSMMKNRDRAWRRKKSRVILAKVLDTRDWLKRQLTERRKTRSTEIKRRAQDKGHTWSLLQEALDF